MAERALCRHAPKVGAECLNWARSDLCGRRGVIPVPTAIMEKTHLKKASRPNLDRLARKGRLLYRGGITPRGVGVG